MATKGECKVKIMLVGEENVGKTSLLRALKVHLAGSGRKRKQTITGFGTIGRATTALFALGATGKKKDGEEETQVSGDTLSTDGIDLTVEPLPISELAMALSSSKERTKPKIPLSFSVWDFGGQEVYHTTHSFFLTERSIYLVVFRADRDEKESRVSYWLNAIKSHAPNAPILIVATHLDKYVDSKGGKKLKPHQAEEALNPPIMEKYKSKFSKLERTIRAVSTTTYKGMDELIRHIHEVAIKQPYAQELPPERWTDLENIFLDTRRRHNADGVVPILSWEDTANVSKIAQFPTNDQHAELIKACDYLHETGIIFRHIFTDEQTGLTRRTIILDPQWAARVFSTVVTTKHGFLRTGVMDEQKLFDQLWREFPKTTHAVLLDLFQQFDLLHKIVDEKGKYAGEVLIPATLPTTKPSDVQSLLPGKETSLYQFERRYAFEFVPAGLFSRYLVKVMNLADALRYWRYGCLLHHSASKTHALVELKPQSNVMSIIVRSETDASQFFCKLAELFEFLIEHFFKIDYQPQYMDPITSTHFSREQIEEASVRGDTTITNKEGTVISIDRVAPDLALTTFAALQIDIAQEVELLPTPLGEGAFAIVYEGVYKQEKVAVKRLLRCSTPEQQKRMFSEFRREVLTMSQLSHPNIVNLKGFSNTPPFSMVMELVPHGTLYEFLRRPDPIPWNLRIRIAYDIACAMHFLHSADPPLIHKDLKSPNVLMAGTKYDDVVVAKVADFGISGKLYANKFKAISAKEREVENPTWLAPEVVKTQPYTAAADVYPYGVMLWELCARTHPFDEFKCEFPTDLEDVITQGKRPTIPKDCPRAFEALIQDCWHDNPAQRPTFAQILARFPSIISEVAPGLPSLLARIKRDLNEFNKKSEAQRKARDVERQEKWKKMREEEMAREAERKRNAAISSSSGFSASEDLDSSTSMDESTEASEGREGRSASDSKSSEEIKTYIAGTSPAHSALPLLRDDSKSKSTEDVPGLRRSARANVLNYEMGTVYQKMSEVELKDLWIQRGIPLQDGISKDRLAEVLENDDQWLFNQRRFLFSSPPSISSGQANPLKVSGTGSVRATLGSTASAAFLNHTPIPNAVSIPSLYVINPQLTTNEIQERNDLIAKQEKALGEFLKQQETARMELHLKHNRAIESRQRAAAAAATPSTSTTASSTTPPTSGSSTPINTSTDSTAIAPTATGTSRISQLLSAFNQPQSTTQGGAATNSSTSPTPTPGGSNAKLSTPAGPPKNSASMPIVRTVPPRPASTPSPPGSMTIPNSASSSTASSESSASTTNQPSSTSPTTPQAKNTAPVAPVPSTSNTASSTTTTTSTKPALLIPTTSTALVVKPTGSSAPSSPMPSTPTAPSGPSTMTVNGSWSTAARTAGGSPNTAHWRRNPQYTLVVGPGGATVKLTMSQLPRDPLPYIAFYIFKSPEGKRVLDIKEKIYAPDHFVNKEAVEATCNFPEGTFSIMCASFQPETSDFTLMASGTGISSLAPAIEYHVTDISGSWIKGSLAGGCMNHPTWRSNPKFALKVTDTSNKTKITGTLIAQTEVGCGFYVFTASNQNVPIAKSGFTTVSVGHEFSLSAGDYVIVPTTYEFGKESAFEITLYSDKPVELSTL